MGDAAPEQHQCPECEEWFWLSGRNSLRHRTAGTRPICGDCRHPVKQPTEEERAELRRWWVEESGLSLVELREIGFSIWPELAGDRAFRLVKENAGLEDSEGLIQELPRERRPPHAFHLRVPAGGEPREVLSKTDEVVVLGDAVDLDVRESVDLPAVST